MLSGTSFAKKRGGAVGPPQQEMVSLLGSDSTKTSTGKTRSPARGKRGGAFSAMRNMIPTRMVPSMDTAASELKKRAKGGDEMKVSLLDPEGNPRAAPEDRKQKAAPSPPWTKDRIIRYLALMVVTAFITYLIRRPKEVRWEKISDKLVPKETGEDRCFGTEHCGCPDPTLPLQKTGNLAEQWKRHHDEMVETAKKVGSDLDIVFLGDSMIERMSGTDGMGAATLDGYRSSFEKRFSKGRGGRMEGKAFGTTEDTGPNVLWHLENGLLEPLNPRVWFIMIGANDLFTNHCNDHLVLANILNVAKVLSLKHPESMFVIHEIMPRKDNPNSKSHDLGKNWKRAQDINSELRKFCKKYRNFYYIASSRLFVKPLQRRPQFESSMMTEDGVHPTLQGFEKWQDHIVDKLVPVLRDFEKFKEKIRKENGN
eukprot:scaffold1637_cov108-Cylindrotheca_fusiformis.AAC.4